MAVRGIRFINFVDSGPPPCTTNQVSHRFEIPIKGYRVMNSFMLLAGFEFSVGMYG